MSFYRRKLPHWDPEGADLFITWRLNGSLPGAPDGPTWLEDPRIAACVVEALFNASEQWHLCDLLAWVVMINHVHVLIRPHRPISQFTRAVKSASARAANLILGRSGQPFWQAESFDRWIRSAEERTKPIEYIDWNPVSAGLVERVEDWPWSSATWDRSPTCHGQVGDLPYL